MLKDRAVLRLRYSYSANCVSGGHRQRFTAEIAVVLRWKDPRLAHTGNGVVRYPMEQVWHPRVSIVNETNAVSRKFPDSVSR